VPRKENKNSQPSAALFGVIQLTRSKLLMSAARMRRHTLFVRAVVAIFPNQRIPKMHVTNARDIHVPPVRANLFPPHIKINAR
jgi:hypothetical protein